MERLPEEPDLVRQPSVPPLEDMLGAASPEAFKDVPAQGSLIFH